ncbi:MAG: phage major capsid protein [Lachnospiraceae bacterium]|nr:phage major capsid protein [Lachnospiraceae bacterium]
MKRKEYETKRAQLMNEAQQLINEGKTEEAQKKMQEITDLDEQWDAIAQAQANFNALNKDPKPYEGMVGYNGGEKLDAGQENARPEAEQAWASKEYEQAWAKSIMGKQLTDMERKTFEMVNEAYTHTTDNTQIVIPKNVSKHIWEFAGEMYPYFNAVSKSYVNGTLSMIQEKSSTDAKWYEEDNTTEDGKETFKEFQLNGCELSRAITISWKLKEMAIEEFIPYIERKMARKMGAAAGYGTTHGKGAISGQKPEPIGTVTALIAEEGRPQIVTYAKGKTPTYENFTNARSKIKSGYGAGLKVYANSYTIWNVIANVQDGNKRPIFSLDPRENGGFKVLGMPCMEDDSMADGEILISNAEEGYHLNINKEVSMMTEDHVKLRKTDYCGYAIMDGNILTSKAHALLTCAENLPEVTEQTTADQTDNS